jgi:hypothetical protein
VTVTMGASSPPARAATSSWSGFGASLSSWRLGHVLDVKGCPSSSCYGPTISSYAQPYQFMAPIIERGRVAGYEEGLSNGTPQVRAVLAALELFPADTTAGTVTRHRDMFGRTCAFVNLQSKTLERWFTKKDLGGYGTVGVELLTVTRTGRLTYNPGSINLLNIVPTYLGSGDNC